MSQRAFARRRGRLTSRRRAPSAPTTMHRRRRRGERKAGGHQPEVPGRAVADRRAPGGQPVPPQRRPEPVPDAAETGEPGRHQGAAEAEVVAGGAVARLLPPMEAQRRVPVADQRAAERRPDAGVVPAADDRGGGQRRTGADPPAAAAGSLSGMGPEERRDDGGDEEEGGELGEQRRPQAEPQPEVGAEARTPRLHDPQGQVERRGGERRHQVLVARVVGEHQVGGEEAGEEQRHRLREAPPRHQQADDGEDQQHLRQAAGEGERAQHPGGARVGDGEAAGGEQSGGERVEERRLVGLPPLISARQAVVLLDEGDVVEVGVGVETEAEGEPAGVVEVEGEPSERDRGQGGRDQQVPAPAGETPEEERAAGGGDDGDERQDEQGAAVTGGGSGEGGVVAIEQVGIDLRRLRRPARRPPVRAGQRDLPGRAAGDESGAAGDDGEAQRRRTVAVDDDGRDRVGARPQQRSDLDGARVQPGDGRSGGQRLGPVDGDLAAAQAARLQRRLRGRRGEGEVRLEDGIQLHRRPCLGQRGGGVDDPRPRPAAQPRQAADADDGARSEQEGEGDGEGGEERAGAPCRQGIHGGNESTCQLKRPGSLRVVCRRAKSRRCLRMGTPSSAPPPTALRSATAKSRGSASRTTTCPRRRPSQRHAAHPLLSHSSTGRGAPGSPPRRRDQCKEAP